MAFYLLNVSLLKLSYGILSEEKKDEILTKAYQNIPLRKDAIVFMYSKLSKNEIYDKLIFECLENERIFFNLHYFLIANNIVENKTVKIIKNSQYLKEMIIHYGEGYNFINPYSYADNYVIFSLELEHASANVIYYRKSHFFGIDNKDYLWNSMRKVIFNDKPLLVVLDGEIRIFEQLVQNFHLDVEHSDYDFEKYELVEKNYKNRKNALLFCCCLKYSNSYVGRVFNNLHLKIKIIAYL